MFGFLLWALKAIVNIVLLTVLALVVGVGISIWFASILRSDDCPHCSCRDNCIIGKGTDGKCNSCDEVPFACGIEYDKM